jgi:hypothetical protein
LTLPALLMRRALNIVFFLQKVDDGRISKTLVNYYNASMS